MANGDLPSDRLERAIERLYQSDVPEEDYESILDLVDGLDATTTQATYCNALRVLAESCDGLCEQTPEELNQLLKDVGDERGWSDSTRPVYESAVRKFIGQDGQEDSDIDSTSPDRSSVDERTVLTVDEFHAIREACIQTRDKALVDFLGYTGQRLSVAQQLTVGDVELEDGQWHFPKGEGFKGAEKTMRKRPLLGALKSVGEWIEQHPTGEPNDALFTAINGRQGTPGDTMNTDSFRGALKRAADRAGVDKPANPHAFRHHFVTVAKKQYGMDNETIKKLIGHSPKSNVMQTTYAHLSDDDHIAAAEEAFGLREDEEEDYTAPPVCPACHRPLRPDTESCPSPGCKNRWDAGSVPMSEGSQELAANLLPYLGHIDDEELGQVIRQHVESQAGE